MIKSFILVLVGLIVLAQSAASHRSIQGMPSPPPSPCPPPPPPLPPSCPTNLPFTDVDILNFALNLECLEAEFYSWAAFGHGLDSTLLGGGPGSVGGQKASLSSTANFSMEVAMDEMHHVAFLRKALGNNAVPCPKMDIGPAFAKAADLAFNKTLNPPFNPYLNDLFFIIGSYIFEDVGVTAYNGAAPYIMNRTYLGAAASILAVEGYHAGWARTQISLQLYTETPYGVTVGQISDAISDLRNKLGGVYADQGVLNVTSNEPNIVPADDNSLAFARLPSEVIPIVAPFFPEGLNGYFK